MKIVQKTVHMVKCSIPRLGHFPGYGGIVLQLGTPHPVYVLIIFTHGYIVGVSSISRVQTQVK